MENILGGKFESSKISSEEQVSNPFAAFAHGMIHSVENSYNGVAQVVSGNKADQLKISKQADSNSALAKGAHTAGELVGSGVQLVTIGRMLPEAKSIFGGVVRSGAVGAIYGGLLQPTEGINIGEERFKNALSMAAFTSTYEVARIGAFGPGFVKPTLVQTLGRGSFAGGLGGASHEIMSSTLNGRELTIDNVGKAAATGMLLGAGMELTSMAYGRTNIRSLTTTEDAMLKGPMSEGSKLKGSLITGTRKPAEVARDPELLSKIREASKGSREPSRFDTKDGKPLGAVGPTGKIEPEFVQIFKWEPAYNSPEARAAVDGPGY